MRTTAAAVVILLTACATPKVVPPAQDTIPIRVRPIGHGAYTLTTLNDWQACRDRNDWDPCKNTKSPLIRLMEAASNFCAKSGKAVSLTDEGGDVAYRKVMFSCVAPH